MKKARKKRIVRRKRRISEREIMRIKRKLKKSAKKLRLGAKRTGAYVYGTLRRIVGNPAIPANMSNPEYVSAYRRAQRMAKSGRPIGIYAFRSGGAWRFGVGEYGATRLPGDELVSIFNAPRGLRGNPSFASLHPRDRATADKFVDYVYGFYGKGGLDSGDFGNRGFTRREIERAVAIYIDQIRKKKTEWGGGDSIDRERVRKILQPSYSFA